MHSENLGARHEMNSYQSRAETMKLARLQCRIFGDRFLDFQQHKPTRRKRKGRTIGYSMVTYGKQKEESVDTLRDSTCRLERKTKRDGVRKLDSQIPTQREQFSEQRGTSSKSEKRLGFIGTPCLSTTISLGVDSRQQIVSVQRLTT